MIAFDLIISVHQFIGLQEKFEGIKGQLFVKLIVFKRYCRICWVYF